MGIALLRTTGSLGGLNTIGCTDGRLTAACERLVIIWTDSCPTCHPACLQRVCAAAFLQCPYLKAK
eukprot:364938-Chlamydomonas_euryale.AAC.9